MALAAARRGRPARHDPRRGRDRSVRTAGSSAALPVTGALPGHPSVPRDRRRARRSRSAPAGCARASTSRPPSLDRLSDAELRAVLAHEQHHGALRDPLRLAVGRVLCQALFFLPVLRPLHDRYADVAELTRRRRGARGLGGAPRSARLGDARVRRRRRPARSSGSRPSASTRCSGTRRRRGGRRACCSSPRWRRSRCSSRSSGARAAPRARPGDAEPADRLLAAVRARARARAGARLPRGRRRPASGPRAGPRHAHGVDAPLRPPGTTGCHTPDRSANAA